MLRAADDVSCDMLFMAVQVAGSPGGGGGGGGVSAENPRVRTR